MLTRELGIEVGIKLIDDRRELVDQFPHRERGFSALEDEEDRPEVKSDVAFDRVGNLGLHLRVEGSPQHVLGDGRHPGWFEASTLATARAGQSSTVGHDCSTP